MSVIVDFLIVANIMETGEPIGAVNRALLAVDTEREQQFRQLDTDQAGGAKVFTNYVWAGAFNHLLPSEVRGAICSAPWRWPDEVLVVEESGDYEIPLVARTVSQLRRLKEEGE